ncbi:Protein WUSCHEL [Camellia lanceoleosa]|uniref:Protein WUSCHEL n=1 Tax=Camellia lanceoleosa TaxID=1840588 RepID=A0ACC0IF03_9ERIC|nr:Protein WUSCHEL [Camellia lanceoleosa]
MQRSGVVGNGGGGGGGGGWRSEDPVYNKYPNISPAVPSPSSSSSLGMLAVGQMGSYGGYGSVTMEKSFRVSYTILYYSLS